MNSDQRDPKSRVGGVYQTYLEYDPHKFPSPTVPAQDIVSPMMEQMLAWGSMRELTEEELARAVKLDPEQFKNLGMNLDMMKALLEEKKRKILATYETQTVLRSAKRRFHKTARNIPEDGELSQDLRDFYKQAVDGEQLYDLERLWYRVDDDASPLARHLVVTMAVLGLSLIHI